MNIKLFNRDYLIRRFSEQHEVKGYLVSDYRDFYVSLHVHPSGGEQPQANPEGIRKVKRLEAHGSDEKLLAANPATNQKGDFLYFDGDWYECISAQEWDHTILSHVNYTFVLIPPDAAGSSDTDQPTADTNSGW